MAKNGSRSDGAPHATNIARREFLEKSAQVLVAAGIAGGGLQSAKAMQKATQSDVSYQDTPKDGLICADCTFWDGEGGCTIVEGEISADGWCSAWVQT